MRAGSGVVAGLLAVLLCSAANALEPVTMGGIAFAVSAGYGAFTSLQCRFNECCAEPWIRKLKCDAAGRNKKEMKENNDPDADLDSPYYLDRKLRRELHGQPLVYATVPGSIAQHICNPNPKKALVLSFHGWTGGGKNYASNLIAEYLYSKGMESGLVKLYASTHHFPHNDEVGKYKRTLQHEIVEQVKKCPRSMFIFDEVDKMPAGLIDIIKPFLDFHDNLDGVDYRRCIFIFLSNSAGDLITRQLLESWKNGINRDKTSLKDMEEVIALGSFNEKGGLYRADIVEKNLIDAFVPFLPLEKRHIMKCIEDDFKRKRAPANKKAITKIADELEYLPRGYPRYSSTGCKKVQHKVQLYLHCGLDDDDADEDDSGSEEFN